MVPLDVQVYALSVMALTGIAIGVVYDAMQAMREVLGLAQSDLGTAIGDLLYWSLATAMIAAGILLGNWGALRLYVLAGIAAGVWFYLVTASEGVRWLWTGLFELFAQCVVILWTVVSWPVRLTWRILEPVYGWILSPSYDWVRARLRGLVPWNLGGPEEDGD